MSTHSVSQSSGASAPPRRILDVVCRSLKTALTVHCRRRHDLDVTVERGDRTSAVQPVHIRLACSDQIQMTARIRVRPPGGPVYDVCCIVEEGPSRRFTYSPSGWAGTTLSRAPCLGRKLGRFLLDELEQQIGQRYLREQ